MVNVFDSIQQRISPELSKFVDMEHKYAVIKAIEKSIINTETLSEYIDQLPIDHFFDKDLIDSWNDDEKEK